jgi:hypothetical protein
MTPFILSARKKLPPEGPPSENEEYDRVRQLWIDRGSKEPLVSRLHKNAVASQYGETSITETREGADQTEGTLQASPYGETTITKTHEGADQTEATSWTASTHGETCVTFTREGTDQSERSIDASSYGETMETRTREGADQTESASHVPMHSTPGPDPKQLDSRSATHAPHPHF